MPAGKNKASSARATQTTLKKKKALDGYVEAGTVTGACRYAKVNRATWYKWIETDDEFAREVVSAQEQVADSLEEEAISRAVNGSDTLLIFLLKGQKRERYGDKREVSGPGGGPIPVVAGRIEDYEGVIGRLAGGAPGTDSGEPVDPPQPD